MKTEVVFGVVAIVIAMIGGIVGGLALGQVAGTQRQLDAFIAEYDERHGPPPSRPVIRPHRPGGTGARDAIGNLTGE